MPLTAQDVAEITRLLEESQFEELRIEHEGFKLTLKRGAAVKREGPDIATAPAAGTGTGVSPLLHWSYLGRTADRDYEPDEEIR